MFCRSLGFLPQAPHIMLAVHDAGRFCWRHAERRVARWTSSGTAQKHPTTPDRFCGLVNNVSEFVWSWSFLDSMCIIVFFRYLVFYTPFDIGYSVSKFLPVKLVFSVMKEIYRYVNVNLIVYEVNLMSINFHSLVAKKSTTVYYMLPNSIPMHTL